MYSASWGATASMAPSFRHRIQQPEVNRGWNIYCAMIGRILDKISSNIADEGLSGGFKRI